MNTNGAILYEGPSLLTGQPIVVIATGFSRSKNVKTGGMVQTYILSALMNPLDALKTGDDRSVCGGCIHRPNHLTGKRTCYVNVGQAPNSIYKAWKAGSYAKLSDYSIFNDRSVRFGSYGDPAAAPLYLWQNIAAVAKMTTGYTHQWRSSKFQGLAPFCQASCETAEDVAKANGKGWGTFRVVPINSNHDHIVCPASAEAGKVTTCEHCGMCDGFKGLNIAIQAHGATAKNYTGSRTLPIL